MDCLPLRLQQALEFFIELGIQKLLANGWHSVNYGLHYFRTIALQEPRKIGSRLSVTPRRHKCLDPFHWAVEPSTTLRFWYCELLEKIMGFGVFPLEICGGSFFGLLQTGFLFLSSFDGCFLGLLPTGFGCPCSLLLPFLCRLRLRLRLRSCF